MKISVLGLGNAGVVQPHFADALVRRANGKMVTDRAGLLKNEKADAPNYHGICW